MPHDQPAACKEAVFWLEGLKRLNCVLSLTELN